MNGKCKFRQTLSKMDLQQKFVQLSNKLCVKCEHERSDNFLLPLS